MSVKDNEKKMWATIKRHLPSEVFAVRIENAVGRGVPDTFMQWPNGGIWIENKVASPTGIVKMRPEQIVWLYKLHAAGGHGFVLVRWKMQFGLYLGYNADLLDEIGCAGYAPQTEWGSARTVIKYLGDV